MEGKTIDPHFFYQIVNGERFLELLNIFIPPLLEYVSLERWKGTSSSILMETCQHLDEQYPNHAGTFTGPHLFRCLLMGVSRGE